MELWDSTLGESEGVTEGLNKRNLNTSPGLEKRIFGDTCDRAEKS